VSRPVLVILLFPAAFAFALSFIPASIGFRGKGYNRSCLAVGPPATHLVWLVERVGFVTAVRGRFDAACRRAAVFGLRCLVSCRHACISTRACTCSPAL
jgi:hypothetical protein